MPLATWKEVNDFWFDPDHIPLHFDEDGEFDNLVATKFLATWESASQGLLVDWRKDIRGRLAEIIVLDQFSRNLFRNDIRTYSQDKMAIALGQEAVNHPDYHMLTPLEKKYILLPFMHSESLDLHNWAYKYFIETGDEELIYFENLHLEVLKEFGRYPYQNVDLGRKSTPEEEKFLQDKAKEGKIYSQKNDK